MARKVAYDEIRKCINTEAERTGDVRPGRRQFGNHSLRRGHTTWTGVFHHCQESARVTEARQPLGQAVAVGLTLSQILTLYITLMVYYYLDIMQRRLMRKCQQEAPDG